MDCVNELIQQIKEKKLDFIQYSIINPTSVDPCVFLTVVMTTHNRQEQTLYTLRSFENSEYRHPVTNQLQIAVILVDDSTDLFLTEQELSQLTFQITYITIDSCKKPWINPCVNYNIGFNEVQTEMVIIQNGEVCHCGDIIQYVIQHLNDQSYLVFDVCALSSLDVNRQLYQLNFDYVKVRQLRYGWYQHKVFRNRNFHFLTAITQHNLLQLDGFDYHYAFGSCWDDCEFFLRIQKELKLNIVNVINEQTRLLGIHQWHSHALLSYNNNCMLINQKLYDRLYCQYHSIIKPIDPDVTPHMFHDINWYNTPKLPGFSFMIRTKNMAHTIATCLLSIQKNLPQTVPYELIVVDNESQDDTQLIAQDLIDVSRDQLIDYPYQIAQQGLENYCTPVDSIHSTVYLAQFCLMKCRCEWIFVWDPSFEMTEALGSWLQTFWEDHLLKKNYHVKPFDCATLSISDQHNLCLVNTVCDPFFYRQSTREHLAFFKSIDPLLIHDDHVIRGNPSYQKPSQPSPIEKPWWIHKLDQSDLYPVDYMNTLCTMARRYNDFIEKLGSNALAIGDMLPFIQESPAIFYLLQHLRSNQSGNIFVPKTN